MPEAKILRTVPITVPDGPRKGKTDVMVFYSVDAGPARFVRCPQETFSEAAVKELIRKDQQDVAALHGKTFTL